MRIAENPRCDNTIHREGAIVISTIEERKLDLFELLYCLIRQIAKPYEVIVVSDGNIKVPRKIIAKYKELGMRLGLIKVVKGLTLGTCRNVGIRKARAKYICFLDDDALPTRHWLNEMKKSLEAGAEVVGGVAKPLFKHGIKITWWWDEALLGSYVAVGNEHKMNSNGILGCNFAMRKDVVRKIGYFDEDLGLRKYGAQLLGEDDEFVMRAVRSGLEVRFNPYAIVYHKLNDRKLNLAYYKKRALQGGRTMKRIAKKHNNNVTIALFKNIFLQALRGLYLVLTRKGKVTALPIYMKMLLYQVIGWLGS